MGLFYTTFTTFGPNASVVAAALKKLRRNAFISPTVERYTVVYDQTTEEQDSAEIEKLGMTLSEACDAPVLGAVLHDDDVLYLWLFQRGEQIDFYNSLPQYFDPDAEPGPPEGGDSTAICKAFGQEGKKSRIELLLRANLLDDELPQISGELERHQAILKELGMPPFAAWVTYSSIEGNYVPEEFGKVEFARVSG